MFSLPLKEVFEGRRDRIEEGGRGRTGMRKAMSSPEDVMDAGLSEKEERATREKEDQLFSI